jgi:elongation factor Ts
LRDTEKLVFSVLLKKELKRRIIMGISVALIKELRERTGAGMMDCKSVLQEADGDIEKAIEIMRKSGQAKAVKKAGRIAAEGVVKVKLENGKVAMIEVNSETDFVARDETFDRFTTAVVESVLANNLTDIAQVNEATLASFEGKTVEEARHSLVATVGENITVRRVAFIASDNVLGMYQHGAKIGVVVELDGGDEELAKDICMHVAASAPEVISSEDVSDERLEKERRVVTTQAQESGKPKDIVEKMVEGRIKKFVGEISLLGQAFVKNPEMTVGELIKGKAKVLRFYRFEVGEGIDKREDDFAKEVMAQVQGD